MLGVADDVTLEREDRMRETDGAGGGAAFVEWSESERGLCGVVASARSKDDLRGIEKLRAELSTNRRDATLYICNGLGDSTCRRTSSTTEAESRMTRFGRFELRAYRWRDRIRARSDINGSLRVRSEDFGFVAKSDGRDDFLGRLIDTVSLRTGRMLAEKSLRMILKDDGILEVVTTVCAEEDGCEGGELKDLRISGCES